MDDEPATLAPNSAHPSSGRRYLEWRPLRLVLMIAASAVLAGYVTKGDNNNAPDIWRPQPAEIVGEMWFSVPRVGRALVFLRRPGNFAIIAGALTALLLLANAASRRQGRESGA